MLGRAAGPAGIGGQRRSELYPTCTKSLQAVQRRLEKGEVRRRLIASGHLGALGLKANPTVRLDHTVRTVCILYTIYTTIYYCTYCGTVYTVYTL